MEINYTYVYSNKITLKITYRDSVLVDSAVIFKDKRNNYDTKRKGTIIERPLCKVAL